ncbi:MAG: hypothetical protein M3362_14065, partial [Acidobacteriota bacterium]|nr:hypothetical protein [Acidobacteriota bacterium]
HVPTALHPYRQTLARTLNPLEGFDSSHFGDVIRHKKGFDSSGEKRPVFTGLFSFQKNLKGSFRV